MKRWMTLLILGIATACGGGEESAGTGAPQHDNPLVGAWLMYGSGSRGPSSSTDLDNEESILVLGDSTYSLTFRAPLSHITFVETGRVEYDTRRSRATFNVTSTTGMDWSEGEPRKLLTVPDIVPWQREPGERYRLEYSYDDSLMQLAGGGFELAWFVRMPQSGP